MYLFINDINKTDNLHRNSISISDELQQRVNSASFTLSGYNPSYFDDVKIYEWFPIIASDSTSVTIKKSYAEAIITNIFRIWDKIILSIGTEEEEKVSIENISDVGNIKISFTSTQTHSVGNIMGKLRFAWNIVDISDKNSTVLGNISFDVTALDYTRIFDKKLINDSFENRDARYIINDFCNSTINKNIEIDEFNYADTTALRTIWTNNPTLETSDYREGISCMHVTSASTVATFTPINITTIISTDYEVWRIVDEFGNYIVDEFGNYIEYQYAYNNGVLWFWYKCTNVTSVNIKIGSDSSNYFEDTFTPGSWWIYYDKEINNLLETGTVNLENITYMEFSLSSPSTPSFYVDGIRFLEVDFFRHYPYVEESNIFQDFRINRVKPTEVMQRIADSLSRYWYIDYEKNIWLFTNISLPAPITINETSNNFSNLSITHDTSRLINRQVVRGWEETSEATYTQIIEWNSVTREWITKNKFKNLVVQLNDGSSTDTMESWTNTTTIKLTAHGLVTWNYIINRTRSDAVREITYVDADTFTVDTITWQTNGDTISFFTWKSVWVEGINVDTSYNYMSNYNEKSIRSSDIEATLNPWEFLLFEYNEVIPILVQATDSVSMNLMTSILGYSDGIFDGQPIVDSTLSSRSEAIKTAEAMVNKYSNVVITATFQTEQEWLETGQIIRIKDTLSSERNIDQDFIIQSVRCKQIEWGVNRYYVTCSSLLFWMLELLQQILANNRKIKVDENEVINNIETANENIIIEDLFTGNVDGYINSETLTLSDSFSSDVVLPPFYWWDIGGWPTEMAWNEFVWS